MAWLLCVAVGCGCGAAPQSARLASSAGVVEARLEPATPRVGENRMRIELKDAVGKPIDAADLRVKVHMHAMGTMPAMGGAARVREQGNGRYDADFTLDMGGTWLVELEARTPAGGRMRAEGSLGVGTPGLILAAVADAPPAEQAAGEAPPAAHPAEFAIPAGRVQEIGVRSATAELRPLTQRIRALGLVASDESALVDVSLKVSGWVRGLRVDAVGMPVERGQVLFTLYSPELYAAQEEYLQALGSQARAQGSGAPGRADWRVRAAARRLELWDVAPSDLEALARRGAPAVELPIRSPATGYVIEKALALGSAVEPGERLLRIAPLDRVWIDAEVYESDAALLAEPLAAEVELPYLAGRRFEARVAAVYPMLDAATRTLRVRLVLDNPALALRPGMWANVTLEAPGAERLSVPDAAVLRTGERSFVFLDLGGGRFRPQAVELGMRSGDRVEVRSGLAAGQRVVDSGTFLIAAESRLRAALDQW
jgi:Cu(I)/Ag(I) efflux system membrane fusion protein